VAVVCATTLHREAITFLLRAAPGVEVGPVVASVHDLDELEDACDTIDFAVVAQADDAGLAVLPASPAWSWSEQLSRADPILVVSWATTPHRLVELLARAGSTLIPDRENGNGNRRPQAVVEPVVEGLGCLTSRELDVLASLADGTSALETARALGISPHTVRTHITNLLRKLGVHSRLEAVALTRHELARERARRGHEVA
jgi:DNA-binding NarL/FixJ family response regulator